MTNQVKPITLTAETFYDDVLTSDLPVLVDIWAPWCGPCRVIGPIVEELAQDFADQAKIAKLNIDENNALASKYDVQAIPTLLLFQHGQLVDRVVGLTSKATLTDKLNQLLNAETLVTQ
ncbi:MAG: thioredoxin [Cyanobacteria bacterium P01_E01_bin.6]